MEAEPHPITVTMQIRPETKTGLEKLKEEFTLSSIGKVIDRLVENQHKARAAGEPLTREEAARELEDRMAATNDKLRDLRENEKYSHVRKVGVMLRKVYPQHCRQGLNIRHEPVQFGDWDAIKREAVRDFHKPHPAWNQLPASEALSMTQLDLSDVLAACNLMAEAQELTGQYLADERTLKGLLEPNATGDDEFGLGDEPAETDQP
jgi:hypothetical protein